VSRPSLIHPLVTARANELREFFRGYFGPRWRIRLRRRLKLSPTWNLHDLAVVRIEDFARTKGFNDKVYQPHERKFCERLTVIVKVIEMGRMIGIQPLTIKFLLEEWLLHRPPPHDLRDDLHTLEVKDDTVQSEGIVSSSGLPASVERAFSAQFLDPPGVALDSMGGSGGRNFAQWFEREHKIFSCGKMKRIKKELDIKETLCDGAGI
jgi:hypothetical protein